MGRNALGARRKQRLPRKLKKRLKKINTIRKEVFYDWVEEGFNTPIPLVDFFRKVIK